MTASSDATNVNLYSKLAYHPVKDFAPISQLTTNAFVIVVPASSPANSWANLGVGQIKEVGPDLWFAGSGQGNHLGMELLKSMAGFEAMHVPYSGTGPVTIALLAGQIDVALQSPPGVMPS